MKLISVAAFSLVCLAQDQQAPNFLVTPRGTGAGETGLVCHTELTANGEHRVCFKAPDSLASTQTYTVPSSLPGVDGLCLQSTTAGVETWGTCSGAGTATATIDFGSIVDGACTETTFAASGFSAGDAISFGTPSALETGVQVTVWISAANTATVRACNFSGATVDPASGTYRVTLANYYVTASGALDFGSLSDGVCADLTLSVTGINPGNSLAVGLPSGLETGLQVIGFVSAANTATFRACNFSGATLDPASATYRATLN